MPDRGLILLGGLSRHYQWDNESVDKQIVKIIEDSPEIKWAIADSPRTPGTTLTNIRNKTNTNLEILNYSETSTTEIREYIFKASTIWISQDSVSMIYESLSSGASVGLIELRNKNGVKAENTINSLINENILSPSLQLNPTKVVSCTGTFQIFPDPTEFLGAFLDITGPGGLLLIDGCFNKYDISMTVSYLDESIEGAGNFLALRFQSSF